MIAYDRPGPVVVNDKASALLEAACDLLRAVPVGSQPMGWEREAGSVLSLADALLEDEG